jgi:hypothetical protein
MWTVRLAEIITPQAGLGSPDKIPLIKIKIDGIRYKQYIQVGHCLATMNYFPVGKGDVDVWIVYNGTKSGLNSCVYAPWFPLPDMNNLIRTLGDGYFCIDNDYGEMLLNFWLHPELPQYSGMDITPLYGPKKSDTKELRIETWMKTPMGQAASPYSSIQQSRLLKQKLVGNPEDEDNVFRWNHVDLNLPGSESYSPGRPWISKRRRTGEIAVDVHDFCDDLRGTGATSEDAWHVGSKNWKDLFP